MMSGPQVGIERLPSIRHSDGREPMNCRNCRKRKIKCTRAKPACEACKVFKCGCVYDAVPKKRGPKTEVLEALVKRVNGLEKELRDVKHSDSANAATAPESHEPPSQDNGRGRQASSAQSTSTDAAERSAVNCNQTFANVNFRAKEPAAFTDALLDIYFSKLHQNPFFVLDETATRRKLRDGQLPVFLVNAIHAVTIRYVPNLCGGQAGAVRSSQDYARRSRSDIDIDEPCIDSLQALLLLSISNFQSGNGKKSCMLLSHAVNVAFALELHRELPGQLSVPSLECESRRLLFWTCYLMDRFTNTGSRKPPLISDESIHLRLPASSPLGGLTFNCGPFFATDSNRSYSAESGPKDTSATLVEVARLLGATNRYLAAGGVKGDSHFPWHAQSKLACIRSDLDSWMTGAQGIFHSMPTNLDQPRRRNVILSRLIYHLIHCLVYRPFLPVDLTQLAGTGQHQSWQTEAVNICFKNADAIAELVDVGNAADIVYWPAFVGHCLATAGTIHIHGVHYAASTREDSVFAVSSHLLSREMMQLESLTNIWACLQHQCEILRTVYMSHSQAVSDLAANGLPQSLGLQSDDFFDRYLGSSIDGAYVTLSDISGRFSTQDMAGQGLSPRLNNHKNIDTILDPQNGTHALQAESWSSKQSNRGGGSSDESHYGNPTPTADSREPVHRDTNQTNMPDVNVPPSSHNQYHHLAGNSALPQHDYSSTGDKSSILQQETIEMAHSNQGNPFWSGESMDYLTPTQMTDMSGSMQTDSGDDPFLSFLQQMVENDGLAGGDFGELELMLNEAS